jgi:hypothetical protein
MRWIGLTALALSPPARSGSPGLTFAFSSDSSGSAGRSTS